MQPDGDPAVQINMDFSDLNLQTEESSRNQQIESPRRLSLNSAVGAILRTRVLHAVS